MAGRFPKQRFQAKLADESGSIDLVWFNGSYLRKHIQPGLWLRVQGRVATYNHHLQMANPAFDVLAEEADAGARDEALGRRLVPVYPAGEGLKSRAIADAISAALPDALPLIDDHLPEAFRKHRGLPALRDAYRMAKGPPRNRAGP